jgi:DUF3089 family protein
MIRNSICTFALVCSCAIAGLATARMVSAQTEGQNKPAASGPTPAKNDYSNGDTWICRPGRQDSCTVDLSTTVISADGKLKREAFKANPKAPIDCFYIYPTVSPEPTPNADMTLGPAEKGVVLAQFARFGSQCRLYAPLYRQITLSALRAATAGTPMTPDRALAYNDVADAWHYYLDHDNHGRGVVLIGHSQGTGMLTNLIRSEIDGKPVQSRMISAILLGTTLPVPTGKDVGGAFQHIPLCRSASQVGCAITYASFRADAPPPDNTRFGRVKDPSMVSGCTNPAALGGGSGQLHSYFAASRKGSIVSSSSADQKPWVNPPKLIDTPFVSVPGMITAECVVNEHGSYLAITVHGDPKGPRVDTIVGDVVVNGQILHDWGLHLIDANLAMGNLVDIVRQESKAYLAGARKR